MHEHSAPGQVTAAARPSLEVADIFRLHGQSYRRSHSLSKEHLKAMKDIEVCRTAVLGGHVDVCEDRCGFTRISYNSCRNRNCPKCQGLHSARWLESRFERILPTHYFHLVFTLPHDLVPLILHNRRLLYAALFRTAADSLLDLARRWHRLQAQVGFTAILHTWSQEMHFHPHLHIVATGGGLDESQSRWIPSRHGFLIPSRALSSTFRGKYIAELTHAFEHRRLVFPEKIRHLQAPAAFHRLVKKLYRKKWVVYAKQPFGGPEQVFRYLGLYTHKVAISNHRLAAMTEEKVTFLARDNQNPGSKRSVTCTPQEFIRRFLLHILPPGFVKIRHYGLMSPRNASTKLQIARRLLEQGLPSDTAPQSGTQPQDHAEPATWQDLYLRITGIDLRKCPSCGGLLIRRPLTCLDVTSPIPIYTPIFQDSS